MPGCNCRTRPSPCQSVRGSREGWRRGPARPRPTKGGGGRRAQAPHPPALDEAVLLPRPPSGHNLPVIAERFAINTIRATIDQYADPEVQETVAAVQRAQGTYRDWLANALQTRLTAERAAWEATQALAANQSI